MRVAVVGSRSFSQFRLVEYMVDELPQGIVIVTTEAEGVEATALARAKERGLAVEVVAAQLDGVSDKAEIARRYLDRNERLVDDCDLLVAFIDRAQGAAWNCVTRAHSKGKTVKVVRPTLVMTPEPDVDEEEDSVVEVALHKRARKRVKGAGPFAIKRVGLGSYALRRRCYLTDERWAEIVAQKRQAPERLAEAMIPEFVRFFETSQRFGCIHAITTPPRSKKFLDSPHVMDFVCSSVAPAIGTEYVPFFEPWIKTTYGRNAKRGEVRVKPYVGQFVGKIVWVLDDITSSNTTLRAAVSALVGLGIHSHGLAYVVL